MHAPAHRFLPALLLLLPTGPVAAPSPPARPPELISPEVLPDRRVVFRLYAPQAREVTVSGSFWLQEGRTEKLARDGQGVWSLTTEPVPADDYSYSFTVDGNRVLDPVNGRIKPGVLRTVFHTSGGVDPEWVPQLERKYARALDDPANVAAVEFFVGSGTNDHSNPSARFWVGDLRRRGYRATYFETDGIHEWPSFRRCFARFAQIAFR